MALDGKRLHSPVEGDDVSHVTKARRLEQEISDLGEDRDINFHIEVWKQTYEVVDLVEETDTLDLIDEIKHEPEIGQCIRQITFHPACGGCTEEVTEVPDESAIDFMISQITGVSFLDSSDRERLIADIKGRDHNSILFVLLLLCPKLRILQIDGPTEEFGKTLKGHYERQIAQGGSHGPKLPPIQTIDIIEGTWSCGGHKPVWQNIWTYFFTPGIRSIGVLDIYFLGDKPSPKPVTKCTLENVFLRGVGMLPEQLAEILQTIPKVKEFCYDDFSHFCDFMDGDKPDSPGRDKFEQRFLEAAEETLESFGLVTDRHGDKIYIRSKRALSRSTRCGFGVLSRPLDKPHFGVSKGEPTS
jgi:hypothetical protein